MLGLKVRTTSYHCFVLKEMYALQSKMQKGRIKVYGGTHRQEVHTHLRTIVNLRQWQLRTENQFIHLVVLKSIKIFCLLDQMVARGF